MSIVATHAQLAALQARPARVRNICVLAHVDHGKTTLSDGLIASNGLIHPKLAGKLRFLDWRTDEQERGVTMKSSSIALLYRTDVEAAAPAAAAAPPAGGTAGATGPELSGGRGGGEGGGEEYLSILAEVNNIINAFRSEKYISDVDSVLAGPSSSSSSKNLNKQRQRAKHKQQAEQGGEEGANEEEGGGEEGGKGRGAREGEKDGEEDKEREEEEGEEEEEEDAFAPEKGNVVFASAMDGWAFRLDHFARLYSRKMGASAPALQRALWGDRYFVPKTRRIVGKKAAAALGGGKLKPMFAQVEGHLPDTCGGVNLEVINKVIKSMSLSIPPRDLQHKDPKVVLQSVMSRWLPLARAVLAMVVECLPSPLAAQPLRIGRFLPKLAGSGAPPPPHATVEHGPEADGAAPGGTQGGVPDGLESEADIPNLTDELSAVEPGPGLSREQVWKQAREGIEKTERAVAACDASASAPCVVFVLRRRLISAVGVEDVDAGMSTSGAAGARERDEAEREGATWRARIARIWAAGPRRVGPNLLLLPAVEREDGGREGPRERAKGETTAVSLAEVAEPAGPPSARVTGSPHVSIKLGLTSAQGTGDKVGGLADSAAAAAASVSGASGEAWEESGDPAAGAAGMPAGGILAELHAEAATLEGSVLSGFQLATAGGPLCEEPMWGLGFYIDATIFAKSAHARAASGGEQQGGGGGHQPLGEQQHSSEHASGGGGGGADLYGPFSGQVITAVREACRSAVMAHSPRLVEAMYFCEVSTTADALGQVYAVLGKRRAAVLREEMLEGSATFTVHAHVPVAESFGFADDLRRKTSGAASPQVEEELEEFGDGVGLSHNIARRLMDGVRRRKGLPVEEKIVEHGAKQRTRARKV
eukprot:jgi/Mesen1/4054/ME000213S03084